MENKRTLIDAYELVKKIFYVDAKDGGRGWVVSLEDLANAPVIDAVEVIRCMECRHYHNHPNGLCYANAEEKPNGTEGIRCVEPDDFCSYGERRLNGDL